ncbi:TIM barrel protein [Planctomicrobium sp. SH668]|uniref:TIM barrel protein n=1 Tax=Planctomicrobium sp. SH668 TaxID=3448126 RepID=UPI003F5AFB57
MDSLNRRDFMKWGVAGAAATMLPARSLQASAPAEWKWIPSMNTGFNTKVLFPEVISMIRDIGFQVISIDHFFHAGIDTPDGVKAAKKLVDQKQLTVDWIHSPFPNADRLFSLQEGDRSEALHLCELAIDAAQVLGGKSIILHMLLPYGLPHDEKRDRMIQHGIESVKKLEEYAEKRNVKLALENGQRRDYDDVLRKLLKVFTSDTVGFCYDSGHENVQRTCFSVLQELGDRLLALHLHDNDSSADRHQIPYEGTIDWAPLAPALDQLAFKGNFGLEVSAESSKFKDPVRFLEECEYVVRKLQTDP